VKYHLDWDWLGAEGDFRKALELTPRNVMVRDWFGWLLVSMTRLDEALRQFRFGLELDPMSVIVTTTSRPPPAILRGLSCLRLSTPPQADRTTPASRFLLDWNAYR
jgi:hypothetical protein